VVQHYLDDLAALEGKSPWRSIVVLGPFMKGGLRKAFRDAARKTPGLTVIDFTPRLREYLAGADAVLTMGGYNTLVEAVALGKRVVVVPRVAPRREQLIRAQRFGERGLVRWIDPRHSGGGAILRAVDGALASTPPAAAALDLGGVDRTVAAIRELLADERAGALNPPGLPSSPP
jgi:predicted glycosyltransferase